MFETLLKDTDLLLTEEERISYIEEALEKSSNDAELIKNYADIVGDCTRSSCPIDRRKEIFSIAAAACDDVVYNDVKDYLLQRAIEYWKKRINEDKNIKKLAERIYNLLESEWKTYMIIFNIENNRKGI